MEECTKEIGIKAKNKEKDTKNTATTTRTKVISIMESPMERECTNGLMGKYMMDSGITDSSKEMEYGKEQREIRILENGNKIKQTDTECMYGRMEIDTKENGKSV